MHTKKRVPVCAVHSVGEKLQTARQSSLCWQFFCSFAQHWCCCASFLAYFCVWRKDCSAKRKKVLRSSHEYNIYKYIHWQLFSYIFFFALVCMLSFLLALVFHFHPSHRTCAALSTVCQIEKSNQFLPHLALSLLLFAASSVFYFCFWSFAFNLTRRYCCFGPCTSLFCRYWLWVHLRFEN